MAGLRSNDVMPGGPPPPLSERGQARTLTPPTEIMRRRRERQEREQAEQEEEKLKRQQQEQSRRQQEQEQEDKRRSQERREQRAAAGNTGGVPTGNTQNAPRVQRQPLDPIQSTEIRHNARNVTDPPRSRPQVPEISDYHRRTLSEAHQAQESRGASQAVPTPRRRATSTQEAQPPSSVRQPTEQAEQRKTKATSSFPHAFERWETLSSHWEGLTGYWIKRLQNNADELHGQPLNQQLARQVTDLSAAGANLFHAVVELQRLRASSERKFQRWFFETRGDQEKQTEEIARLKAQLREAGTQPHDQPVPVSREVQERQERQEREHAQTREQLRQTNDALRAFQESARQENERLKQQADKQLQEMRRELQISRDEARRGWEEIGRMEQSERDRMFSLRSGQATLVGNIQVVPMPRQALSSRPTTREGGLSSHPVQPEDIQYANYGEDRSQTDTDPFTESGGRNAGSVVTSRVHGLLPESQPQTTYPTSAAAVEAGVRAAASPAHAPPSTGAASPRSQPSASQPAFPPRSESMSAPRAGPTSAPGSAGFYQQGQSVLHQQPGHTQPQVLQAEEVRSYGTMSDDGLAGEPQAAAKRDTQGRPAVYAPEPPRSPSEVSDDYGTTTGPPSGYTYPTTNGNAQGVGAPDYSGAGYGGGEWGAVLPRHHHPTRLSDVPEVDEWSRTSPSRASERSRGFR